MEEFGRLKHRGQLTPELTGRLAREAAADFMARRRTGSHHLADVIRLLCEIATLDDEELSTPGRHALFASVVEPLADSFEPQDSATYYAAFANVIEFCRRLPAGRDLDTRLRRFELRTGRDVLNRIERIRGPKRFDLSRARRVKKALILSRVTLGADVEITSIIWQKLKRVLPQAEIVLLAGRKAGELFGGDADLRIQPIRYNRSGGLIDRLSGWLSLGEAVERQIRDLDPEAFIIVDPDSRLTQLGLLPVIRDEDQYFFFESRSFRRPGASSLSQLTAQWVSEVFGDGQTPLPSVCLKREDRSFAQALMRKIRQGGASHLISVNFGVGENPKKRIPDPFEQQLVLRLIRDGACLLLDKGAGGEEARRIGAIVKTVERQGKRAIEVNERNALDLLQRQAVRADVFSWQGGIGRFGALLAQTDQYLGYDSAGQHIAAALGIPTLVVFAGYSSPVFVERWRPAGRGRVKTLPVDTVHGGKHIVSTQLVEQIAYEMRRRIDH